ncbi:hypothetical protein Tco_0611071 [Tanacetum coccineum]
MCVMIQEDSEGIENYIIIAHDSSFGTYQHIHVSCDSSNSLIAESAHYTSRDGEYKITSSNTGTDKKLMAHLSFLHSSQIAHKITYVCMISMDAHNTQQQLALQSEDGHHTITLSNISNTQQLDYSFDVPTQRINSSQHDIGMVYMDTDSRTTETCTSTYEELMDPTPGLLSTVGDRNNIANMFLARCT